MDKRSTNEGNPDAELLIEHMAHGFAYCRMQYENGRPCDFTYLMVNPAFGRITGLNGIVGKKVTEVIPGIWESNPELFDIYGRVALTGKSESFESYVPGLGVWFVVTAYSPKKGYFVATFEDITPRKIVEIALQKSEANLKAMVENSPLLTWLKDSEGRYISINRKFADFLQLKDAQQAVGKTDLDLQPKEFAEKYRNDDAKIMGTHQSIRTEESGFDGKRTIWVETYKAPILNDSGQAIGTVGFANDITDRKNAEQSVVESMRKLEEKEMAKTRFLAAAGHDLRQPLAAANLFIDALKFTAPTPDQSEIIKRLDQAMSNFNDLLDALLNVSKLDAGIIKPGFISINVSEIFGWIEESFAPMASQKHLQFKLHFPTKKPLVVRCDLGLLKSVLMNLISNAIKFTANGGMLVSARQRGEDVLIQVWDTGIGIRKEDIGKIFDDFYQIDNQQRDRTKGLGLGLSIARRTLALWGGEITCRSQIGRGSVFELHLPMDNSSINVMQDSPISKSLELEEHRSFVKGKRFVVLEDDAMVSEALSKSLKIMGGEVECFDNAESALEHPDIGNADCYIVDYMLPGDVDGVNFLLRLHQQLHTQVCAVMMSGNTSTYFIRNAEFFSWPVVHKPVNISKLISTLSEQYSKND